jgi:hypothetical protein
VLGVAWDGFASAALLQQSAFGLAHLGAEAFGDIGDGGCPVA